MSPDEHKAIIRAHAGVLFNQQRIDPTEEFSDIPLPFVVEGGTVA